MSVGPKEDGILCLQVGVRTLRLLHLVIYDCLVSRKNWPCDCFGAIGGVALAQVEAFPKERA